MTILIGLAGRKGAGKSTLADYLEWHHGFEQNAFADPIKSMLDVLFAHLNMDISEVSMKLFHDRKDAIDNDNLFGKSPRELMQTLGTEWGRELVHPDLWVKCALADYERVPRYRYVFSDVRFPNEAQAIRDRGGHILWVEGPCVVNVDDHKSERLIKASNCDHIVSNSFGDIEAFCDNASALILALETVSDVR